MASFGHTLLYHAIDQPLTLLTDQKIFTISTPIGTFKVDKREVFAKYFSPLLFFGTLGLKRILEHKRSPKTPTNTGFVVLACRNFIFVTADLLLSSYISKNNRLSNFIASRLPEAPNIVRLIPLYAARTLVALVQHYINSKNDSIFLSHTTDGKQSFRIFSLPSIIISFS